MKILITGDRNWTDYDAIVIALRRCTAGKPVAECLVIEGEANGADTLGKYAAQALAIPVAGFKAKWDQHGKAAGPIRNTEMLNENPDIVLAFHDNLLKSKGTKNMIEQARKKGTKILLYYHSIQCREI